MNLLVHGIEGGYSEDVLRKMAGTCRIGFVFSSETEKREKCLKEHR
jgi:hypothetical protein